METLVVGILSSLLAAGIVTLVPKQLLRVVGIVTVTGLAMLSLWLLGAPALSVLKGFELPPCLNSPISSPLVRGVGFCDSFSSGNG